MGRRELAGTTYLRVPPQRIRDAPGLIRGRMSRRTSWPLARSPSRLSPRRHGWGAWTRTTTNGSKVRCPAVRRHPSAGDILYREEYAVKSAPSTWARTQKASKESSTSPHPGPSRRCCSSFFPTLKLKKGGEVPVLLEAAFMPLAHVPLAQSVEHPSPKRAVPGSSPGGYAIKGGDFFSLFQRGGSPFHRRPSLSPGA